MCCSVTLWKSQTGAISPLAELDTEFWVLTPIMQHSLSSVLVLSQEEMKMVLEGNEDVLILA